MQKKNASCFFLNGNLSIWDLLKKETNGWEEAHSKHMKKMQKRHQPFTIALWRQVNIARLQRGDAVIEATPQSIAYAVLPTGFLFFVILPVRFSPAQFLSAPPPPP